MKLHSLNLTWHSTWIWMVGIWGRFLLEWPIFRCELLVLGSVLFPDIFQLFMDHKDKTWNILGFENPSVTAAFFFWYYFVTPKTKSYHTPPPSQVASVLSIGGKRSVFPRCFSFRKKFTTFPHRVSGPPKCNLQWLQFLDQHVHLIPLLMDKTHCRIHGPMYSPMKTIKINQSCRYIYHKWSWRAIFLLWGGF